MSQIDFFIPLRRIPSITQQEHQVRIRNGKPQFYEPAELKEARQLFRAHLAGHVPEAPYSGPIDLQIVWSYPPSDMHPWGTWKTSKPDTDNLIKMIKDEMTRLGFWGDDAQVCSEWSAKLYGRVSGVFLKITELDETNVLWR